MSGLETQTEAELKADLETMTKEQLKGELGKARDKILETDVSIVKLLVKRFKLCVSIAYIKYWLTKVKDNGEEMGVEDKRRETVVYSNMESTAAGEGGFDYIPKIRVIYNAVIGGAKDLQKTIMEACERRYGRRS